jgi:hypothetical protein
MTNLTALYRDMVPGQLSALSLAKKAPREELLIAKDWYTFSGGIAPINSQVFSLEATSAKHYKLEVILSVNTPIGFAGSFSLSSDVGTVVNFNFPEGTLIIDQPFSFDLVVGNGIGCLTEGPEIYDCQLLVWNVGIPMPGADAELHSAYMIVN